MKDFIEHFERFFGALRDPEYAFLLLEPIFIYGIGIGILAFALGFFAKDNRVQIAALVVLVASGLCIVPYLRARTEAQDRIQKVYQYNEPDRATGFAQTTQDRVEHKWIFLWLAGMAGAAMLVGPRRNRLGLGLAGVSVALGCWALSFSLWMHLKESTVYHANLQSNESPIQRKLSARDRDAPAKEPPLKARPIVRPLDVSATQ